VYTDTGPGGVVEPSTGPSGRLDGFDVVSAGNTARLFALTAPPPSPDRADETASPAAGGPEDPIRMSQLFRVHKDDTVGATVLELTLPDQLDDSDFDRLNEALLALIDDASPDRIIDLSRVNYMGSAMLGMMVNLRQQVKNIKGRLVLCGMSQRLTDIFRTCCMERLFTIARTRTDALRIVK
jgi:stage II sporulation protein AA (anti-sigma F factor antagonist)